MSLDPSATKYLIRASITTDGIVEKPDVIGAIFGQSEGLLGEELDLRDLQKSGRIGRIEVEISAQKGKSEGEILIPSSLDQVETAILGAALETIDRVGPCKAEIKVEAVEDVRMKKRTFIVDRAKELLLKLLEESRSVTTDLTESVRQSIQVEEIVSYGEEHLPAGPNVETSDSIIVVEGRSDVLNLLRHGIKNAIAVEGTSVPETIVELSKEKNVVAFVDGDRGGELILKELLQVCDVDFIARAPRSHEVEELTQKQIIKALRNKIPAEQFIEMYSLDVPGRKNGHERGNGNGGRSDKGKNRGRDKSGDKGKSSKDSGQEKKAEKEEKKSKGEKEKPAKEEKNLSPEQENMKKLLKEIMGKHHARLISEEGDVVADTPIKDMFKTIEENEGKFRILVLDGIITQKLLDTAASMGVTDVAGLKTGNITKKPESVRVWTKEDLW
ncbi:MAG: DNA primase [Thermoplasmata archaeon]|nr:DNA primase [Thermoplasmata archaeon]